MFSYKLRLMRAALAGQLTIFLMIVNGVVEVSVIV